MWDWWDKIKPQVEDMFKELHAQGVSQEELMEVLNDEFWINSEYVNTRRFGFGTALFTLSALCDMFNLLTGNYHCFHGAMNYKLKEIVKSLRMDVSA